MTFVKLGQEKNEKQAWGQSSNRKAAKKCLPTCLNTLSISNYVSTMGAYRLSKVPILDQTDSE